MSGKAQGAGAATLRFGLLLAEPWYALGAWTKNRAIDWGVLNAARLPVPVISVGNITTGGTGKTPLVRFVVEALVRAGRRPGILMRGYRATVAGGSDEAKLLESAAPVFVGANRFECGRRALQADASLDCFVLDDGFQHRALHRDLDVVLIDATNPFGFDHVLPRGMLREPIGGLARAGVFVVTRLDQSTPAQLDRINRTLARHNPAAPVLRCSHELIDARRLDGKRVVAFCGIGNPEAFFDSLRRAGATVIATRAFADHHPYTREDLKALDHPDADLLVTTEKDAVRLQGLDSGRLPVEVMRLRLRFEGRDEQVLLDLLRGLAGKS